MDQEPPDTTTNPVNQEPDTTTTTNPINQEPDTTTTTDLLSDSSDPLSSSLLCPSLPTLLSLSSRGQYHSLLTHISTTRTSSPPLLTQPHHHLIYLSFNALSLFKLRRFSDSSLELQSLLTSNPHNNNPSLDPFDSPKYLYQTYPSTYPPTLTGSMLPFSIRYLYAELPQRLNNRPETLDRLYSLLEFTRLHPDELWRKREAFVLSALACNHFAHKEFDVCLSIINILLEFDSLDSALLSKMGYVQMQIGDVEGAKASFERVKELENGGGSLVGRNRALECLVAKDYVSAVREYDECIERDAGDIVAVNNKALCLMYLRDLSDSIKLLEGALERVPTAAVNETVVVNLCSMYELAYVNHGEVKKSLSDWIARVAPDDFDSSCTRA